MAEIPNALVILMGMGVVFIGLICIVILCTITGAIIPKLVKEQPEPELKPAVQPIPSVAAPTQNRGEVIAAVAAVLAEELGTDVKGLRIVEFKEMCN